MKAVGKNVILRYRKKDLDTLKKGKIIYTVNSQNNGEHICSVAMIESSNNPDLPKGSEAIVSYRIAWDVNINDRDIRSTNAYFIQDDGEDELRFATEYDVFGIVKDGKIIPKREYLFCEIPPLVPEMYGKLVIPESLREQKTDQKSYSAVVKYVSDHTKKEYGLKKGDTIWASSNSDIKKAVGDDEFIAIPMNRVLMKDGQPLKSLTVI